MTIYNNILSFPALKWRLPIIIFIIGIPFNRYTIVLNIVPKPFNILLPLLMFKSGYYYSYCKAKSHIKNCNIIDNNTYIWKKNSYKIASHYIQYTRWVYRELLFLSPIIPFSRFARKIAIINCVGLGIGIHSLYFITNYQLLRELGDIFFINELKLNKPSFCTLIFCDSFIHLLPWILCHIYFNDLIFLSKTINKLSILISIITGCSHISWGYLLIKQWDVSPLYKEYNEYPFTSKTKYNNCKIKLGWILIFLSHIIGGILYS